MELEYLIIIENAEEFCNNKKSFLKFLEVDDLISIKESSLIYREEWKLDLSLELLSRDKMIVFNMILFYPDIPTDIIQELTRRIKKNIYRINPGNTHLKVIWNQLAIDRTIEAYPIINQLENMMRRLISKFMIVKIGVSWYKTNTHKDIQTKKFKTDNSKFNDFDFIYNLDFIELSDVLFKKYRTLSVDKLEHIIARNKNSKTIELIKIIDFLPKSNWERFFSEIVEKEEDFIKNKWSELYDIRNEVAHNRFINQEKFKRLNDISEIISPILEDAFTCLDEMELSDDDIKQVRKVYEHPRSISISKLSLIINKSVDEIIACLNESGINNSLNLMTRIYEKEIQILENKFGTIYNIERLPDNNHSLLEKNRNQVFNINSTELLNHLLLNKE